MLWTGVTSALVLCEIKARLSSCFLTRKGGRERTIASKDSHQSMRESLERPRM